MGVIGKALQAAESTKQLAQARPSGTGAVSAVLKGAKSKLLITSIIVCNTTGGSVNYSIYIDNNGTTYDQTTALFYACALAANTTVIIESIAGIPIDRSTSAGGNLAVQTSSGSALTFTINGIEI